MAGLLLKIMRVVFLASYMSFFGLLYTILQPIGKRRNQSLKQSARQLNAQAAKNIGADSVFVKLPTNNITLHVIEAGDRNGRLVVLLHGFPDCWHSWAAIIPDLVKQGYFVVAPDMRGYNLSDKPKAVDDYHLRFLTSDVKDLIEHYQKKTAVVAAHDWGGVVGWRFAERYPEYLDKLIIMNAPHSNAYQREVRRNPAQALSSWYILWFQIPFLAANLISFAPHSAVHTFFKTKKKNCLNKEDVDLLAASYAQDGALPAMINYYKSFVRGEVFGRRGAKKDATAVAKKKENTQIQVPTLVLWGENDVALVPELAMCSEWVKNLQVTYIPNCSHWVPYEVPEIVSREIIKFIA